MTDWTLNELVKDLEKTYIAGSEGVVGTPGSPEIPGYCYWETVTTTTSYEYSPLPPEAYETTYSVGGMTVGRAGYRIFDGEKAYLAYTSGGAFVYQKSGSSSYQRQVCVDAVPAVAPTPAVEPSPAQLITDYNFGWNAGAVETGTVAVDQAIRWRFSPSDVGAAVGVSSVYTVQGNSYNEMDLCFVAQGGVYVVIANHAPVTGFRSYSQEDEFAVARYADRLAVYHLGMEIHSIPSEIEMKGDCSLYAGLDRILDAEKIAASEIELHMLLASTATDMEPIGRRTRTFGPGTHLGVVGWATGTEKVFGSAKVGGTVIVWFDSTTQTDAVTEPSIIRAFGAGTANGSLEWSSRTQASIPVQYATANLSFVPLTGSGAAPDVYVGWTGNYIGDSVHMEPMTAYGESGLVTPNYGIGDAIFVPMTNIGSGLTGETSTSSSMSFLYAVAIGSEGEYGTAEVNLLALSVFADDVEEVNMGIAIMLMNPFTLISEGAPGDINGGTMVARNKFSAQGYGGGQLNQTINRFDLTGEASSPGVGTLQEAIGYV